MGSVADSASWFFSSCIIVVVPSSKSTVPSRRLFSSDNPLSSSSTSCVDTQDVMAPLTSIQFPSWVAPLDHKGMQEVGLFLAVSSAHQVESACRWPSTTTQARQRPSSPMPSICNLGKYVLRSRNGMKIATESSQCLPSGPWPQAS